MKHRFLLILFCIYYNLSFSQILLGPETFDSDILIHGASAPTTVWFAPDYYVPIDFSASGGCFGGYAGYQGSWNNYWMNFLRTPAVDCSLLDTVILTVDISNSYITSHPNDKVYFNMWIDGGYHDAVINQTILFDQLRDCQTIEVTYDLTPYIDKSGILFYLNASCGYNDSQTYYLKLDNITIKGNTTNTATCKPFAGNDTAACGLDFCINDAFLSDSLSVCNWTINSQPVGALINFSNINDVNTCIYPNEYGYYEFVLTETNGTCTDSDTIAVTFLEIPVPFAGIDSVVCGLGTFLEADSTSFTGVWQTTSGITFADTANPNTYITSNNYGNYTLIWTVTNQFCYASDSLIIVFDPCSKIDNLPETNLNIFPNPTTGKIIIKTEEIKNIEVIDLQGIVIKQTVVASKATQSAGKNEIATGYGPRNNEIDLSRYPKGIYFIKVTTNKGVAVSKIVKN